MWIALLKLLPSIIASSAITAMVMKYFFDRRLEKYEVQLRLNEQFLSSLITALNLLINDYKSVVLKARTIRSEVEGGNLNGKSIDELKQLIQQYQNTFRAHRFYLSRLIPFGKTDSFLIRYDDIKFAGANYLLQLLALMQNEASQQKLDDYTRVVLRAVHYVDLSYESVCQKMNAIIEHIQKGKNPFMIRWSDLESRDWLDKVEMMHDEMSWLEFSSDVDELSQYHFNHAAHLSSPRN